MQAKYYVYVHRDTSGEIFYVGKGTGDRDTSSKFRNTLWDRKVKQDGNFWVERIADNLFEDQALQLEAKLLASLDSKNLVNIKRGTASEYPSSSEELLFLLKEIQEEKSKLALSVPEELLILSGKIKTGKKLTAQEKELFKSIRYKKKELKVLEKQEKVVKKVLTKRKVIF